MQFVKKYNQEITLALFCVGMFCYALGLERLSRNFATQSFFHIGALLFLVFNYHHLTLKDWRYVRIPLVCFLIVIILGLLTLLDTTFIMKASDKIKTIKNLTLCYLILFSIAFLYAYYTKLKCIKFLLAFLAFLCAFVVLATLYEWVSHSFATHRQPLFFWHIIVLNIWLFGAGAFCLAGVVIFERRIHKLLCIAGWILTFLAVLANGERSFLLGFVALSLAPFFICHYRHKAFVRAGVVIVSVAFCVWGYSYSKTLSDRYNFGHMIDVVSTIWATPPLEMGQYDAACFAGLECAPESLARGKNAISLEHSSLARLAMYKSALHLFLTEPLKPHLISMPHVGFYLHAYYPDHDPYRMYINHPIYGGDNQIYGYPHIHSAPLSLLVCYGAVGFLAIVVFQLAIFYRAYRGVYAGERGLRLLSLSVALLLIALWVQVQFDILYGVNLQPFFIFLGIFLGYSHRKRDEAPANN